MGLGDFPFGRTNGAQIGRVHPTFPCGLCNARTLVADVASLGFDAAMVVASLERLYKPPKT
jgi:hypothetical protein